jgi:hypothetical protein
MILPRLSALLLGVSLALPAATITVSGTSTVTGGLLAAWVHTYNAGAPDLLLQQIRIDVAGSGLIFDTVTGGPGALVGQGVGTVLGGAITGFTGASPSNAALDGQTLLTLSFNDFQPAEFYSHTGDVDQNASCAGLGPIATGICITANATNTGAELAGIQMILTFGGAGYATTDITATFARTGPLLAQADWSGEVVVIPEPSTYALFAAGLGVMAAAARRRR